MAAASPDGGAAANAVVTAWRSFDASGLDGHRQRHVRRGSPRHQPASSFVSYGSMITPMFGTVSSGRGHFQTGGRAGLRVSIPM